jgi:hypothetical protein
VEAAFVCDVEMTRTANGLLEFNWLFFDDRRRPPFERKERIAEASNQTINSGATGERQANELLNIVPKLI